MILGEMKLSQNRRHEVHICQFNSLEREHMMLHSTQRVTRHRTSAHERPTNQWHLLLAGREWSIFRLLGGT